MENCLLNVDIAKLVDGKEFGVLGIWDSGGQNSCGICLYSFMDEFTYTFSSLDELELGSPMWFLGVHIHLQKPSLEHLTLLS